MLAPQPSRFWWPRFGALVGVICAIKAIGLPGVVGKVDRRGKHKGLFAMRAFLLMCLILGVAGAVVVAYLQVIAAVRAFTVAHASLHAGFAG